MIDRIKHILSNNSNISAWKIVDEHIESGELFFVRKELDMERSKHVRRIILTVYVDFEEAGSSYRGFSTTYLHPSMDEAELAHAISETALAASYSKNKPFPMVQNLSEEITSHNSPFEEAPLSTWLGRFADAVYSSDTQTSGRVNSSEFFLNKIYRRLVTSEGIDLTHKNYVGDIEFITNWKETQEEVELYKRIKFSSFSQEAIKGSVEEMLDMSRDKANAVSLPALGNCMILLTGEPVSGFLNYYCVHTNARAHYQKVATHKPGDEIQGSAIIGDKLNILLNPGLEGSTLSAPFDEDGFLLKPVQIIEDGIMKCFWGPVRYTHYLEVPPTGVILNIEIQGGSRSISEMKQEPYLEIAAFSDFQMHDMTGDFGGEIRLGWYFDGEKRIPVTGGSISGNIKNVQQNMYFSKELQQLNSFKGPKTIQLFNVAVCGG